MSAEDDLSFDAEELADGICAWVRVESPSYDIAGVNRMMDLAAQKMAAIGAAIERTSGVDGYADVVAARLSFGHDAATPGILVLGHLDTVHAVGTLATDLPIAREADRLYGPGVLDMKGGMYLACHAVEQLVRSHRRLGLPITFLFIPDEEVGSPSTRALIERYAMANRYVLVPEPGRPDKFVTARHAFLRYLIEVRGEPAHAGVAAGPGRSAISKMAALVTEIEQFSNPERDVTYRVGKIRGGTFVNVIPSHCEAEVLCVAPTQAAFAQIRDRMSSLASDEDGIEVVVKPGPVRPLFQPSPAGEELYEIARRVASNLGLELGRGQFGGGSDGNFTGALGIATLDGLGVVGTGVHTKQEHLLVSSLVPRARLFAGLVRALCERNV